MKYTTFQERRFHQAVTTAMQTVRRILDTERQPQLAAEVAHEYVDKFTLTEYVTNTMIASIMNAFTVAGGLQPDAQQKILTWVHNNCVSDAATKDNETNDAKIRSTTRQTITLRFLADDTCTLFKDEDVEVVMGDYTREISSTKSTTSSGIFGPCTRTTKDDVTTRVVQRVKEYHWKVGMRYQLLLFPGTAVEDAIVLHERSTETIIATQMGSSSHASKGSKIKPPIPERTVHTPVDTNVTWFFSMLDTQDQSCQFAIDRNVDCRTPRRNAQVQTAVDACKNLHDWSRDTQRYFLQRVEREILSKDNPVHPRPTPSETAPPPATPGQLLDPGSIGTMQGLAKGLTFNGKQIRIVEYNRETQRYKAEPVNPNDGLPATLTLETANIRPDDAVGAVHVGPPLHTISDRGLFCPTLPLMENGSVLSLSDVSNFLQEQSRSLDRANGDLSRIYPARHLTKLVSFTEATVVLLCKHLEQLTIQYHQSVDYVEDMLKQQLVEAIGKEVSRADFEQFMRFYYPKLLFPNYCPTPFSHAIRRPGYYPDGIISIEAVSTGKLSRDTSGSSNEPITTWVRSISGNDGPSIYVPINATASVEITGDRYLHGWMQHRFSSEPEPEFQLACRARQFSNFLILLGTVSGPDKFDPKDAIILQNKDEVLIPLLTTVLPSAKEFKDAIQSLSPEQQEFAKAFRAMQLESSVFGICIVQIKPQLEKLLGLPNGALTKEIQLTQDLMSMFVDYQVPSDLMTFDGTVDSSLVDKLNAVRGHVGAVKSMIEASKANQLKEELMKANMRAEMKANIRAEMKAHMRAEMADESSDECCEGCMGDTFCDYDDGASREGCGPPVPTPKRSDLDPHGKPVIIARQETPNGTESINSRKPMEKGELPQSKASSSEDFTMIPKVLDSKIESIDSGNALRSTIIKSGSTWTRKRQENLLIGPTTAALGLGDIGTETKKAFDLLDAISRSGTLSIECAELHVFIAISHCFDNDVMGTVIQDNVNPIAKVERSALLLASTIHGQPANQLIASDGNLQRLQNSFPLLFGSSEVPAAAIGEP